MRCVIQRCSSAAVAVEGRTVASIDDGLLVFAGFTSSDTPDVLERVASKVLALRIFEDEEGRMNRGLAEVGGSILCVSQFTLHADLRRGNRPSFDAAAPATVALPLYEAFCAALRATGIRCEQGIFGAEMQVTLTNSGPVTIILDSADLERPRRA